MPGNETRSFAIRRLSPFQGSLQIIEAGDGQASSSNGLDWRIQVRIQTSHEQGDSLDGPLPDHQTILFGFWSSEGGFHRVPLPPMISSRQIEVAAQPIIDDLLATASRVPFKQIDHCELWLLDKNNLLPLVLISACCDNTELPTIHRLEWQPTLQSDHSFTRTWSKSEEVISVHEPRDELNKIIRDAAGQNPKAQWFLRDHNGNGKGIAGINIDADIQTRQLRNSEFPELLLKNDWQDANIQQLVNDYLDWQAPFLLTLAELNPLTRERLEQLAFRQVFKVEGQHKLWPEVIDEARLRAALIEAQMRRSNPEAGK